jgi:hypothetical protein
MNFGMRLLAHRKSGARRRKTIITVARHPDWFLLVGIVGIWGYGRCSMERREKP